MMRRGRRRPEGPLDRKIRSLDYSQHLSASGTENRPTIAHDTRTCLLPRRASPAASSETCERECGVPNGESVDF